jgi:hypothetical protein
MWASLALSISVREKGADLKKMELDLSGRNVSTTSFVKSWTRLAISAFHRLKSSRRMLMLGLGKLSSCREQDDEGKAVTRGKSLELHRGRTASSRRCN